MPTDDAYRENSRECANNAELREYLAFLCNDVYERVVQCGKILAQHLRQRRQCGPIFAIRRCLGRRHRHHYFRRGDAAIDAQKEAREECVCHSVTTTGIRFYCNYDDIYSRPKRVEPSEVHCTTSFRDLKNVA